MATRIRLRYDSLSNWNTADPPATLLPGEFGVARHEDGTIEVRVGNGANTNTSVNWAEAPQISGAGTIIDGFDFTNLTVGDIIYWNGNGWDSASLSERIKGSGNIFLTEDANGVLTINYGVATWSPTFTPVSIALVEIRRVYGPTNTVLSVGCGSLDTSVRNASATIKSVSNQYYDTFADIPVALTNGAGSGTISNLTVPVPNNLVTQVLSFSYNTPSSRRSEIQCAVTAENETIGGQPYTGSNSDTLEVYVNFGWRFAGFVSPNDYSGDLGSITQMNSPSFSAIVQNPPSTTSTIERTWVVPSGPEQYLYFAHSANGAGSNDSFGWSPKFLDSANQIEPWVEITESQTTNGGDTSVSGLQYRVWRSPNPLAAGSYTLKIQKLQ